MLRRGGAKAHLDAPPDRVYALISDITRMGEWSPETTKAVWVGDATAAEVGARFKGSNKSGPFRWSTKPVIEVADPGREFTFATTNPNGTKKYTRWSYKFTASGGGTEVEESWEELARLPVLGALMMSDRRERQLNKGCADTLQRLKERAEAGD